MFWRALGISAAFVTGAVCAVVAGTVYILSAAERTGAKAR